MPYGGDYVLGHTCQGLVEYNKNSGSCVPGIDEHGHTIGCDDENKIPIMFCPFCGEKLTEE